MPIHPLLSVTVTLNSVVSIGNELGLFMVSFDSILSPELFNIGVQTYSTPPEAKRGIESPIHICWFVPASGFMVGYKSIKIESIPEQVSFDVSTINHVGLIGLLQDLHPCHYLQKQTDSKCKLFRPVMWGFHLS